MVPARQIGLMSMARAASARLVTAQEAIIAPFGGLLRRELGKPASDEAAPHAADEASAIGDELRFAEPMFGARLKRKGTVVSSLAMSSSRTLSLAFRRSPRPNPHLVRCRMFRPLQHLTQCGLSSMSQRRLAYAHVGQRK